MEKESPIPKPKHSHTPASKSIIVSGICTLYTTKILVNNVRLVIRSLLINRCGSFQYCWSSLMRGYHATAAGAYIFFVVITFCPTWPPAPQARIVTISCSRVFDVNRLRQPKMPIFFFKSMKIKIWLIL